MGIVLWGFSEFFFDFGKLATDFINTTTLNVTKA